MVLDESLVPSARSITMTKTGWVYIITAANPGLLDTDVPTFKRSMNITKYITPFTNCFTPTDSPLPTARKKIAPTPTLNHDIMMGETDVETSFMSG